MVSTVLYYAVAALSLLGCAYCLAVYFKRRKRQDIVCDNNSFFLMLISAAALGAAVLYLLAVGEGSLAAVPAVVCVLSMLGLFAWHNEVVIFDEDGFTQRSTLGISHRYRYTDIEECGERVLRQSRRRTEIHTVFYMPTRRFALSRKSANYVEFARRVRKYTKHSIDA